ncbi:MAG: hypothetical protein J6U27_01665, partial [Spirochaetales bacterium]|nr:hypothetical protein [Spirochaetales bacterium]
MKKAALLFLIISVSMAMVFADDVLETVSQSPVIPESDIATDTVLGLKGTEALQGEKVVTIDDVNDVLDAYYRSQRNNLPEIGR